MHTRAPVVLVEGRSDVAAVRVLARRRGVEDPDVVDMGGVTNFRREWRRHADRHVLALCDEAEAGFLIRVLAEDGCPVADAADLALFGCFVCVSDLEDELIGALGPTTARDVLVEAGLGDAFERFTMQPGWRERTLTAQLRRFAGAGSGRKERLAGAWAQALPDAGWPKPLAGLLERLDPPTPA